MSKSRLSSKNICFVGAGSMAEAVIRGLLDTGRTIPERLTAVNHSNRDRLHELKERYGLNVTDNRKQRKAAIRDADIVVLAMKPKDARPALTEISPLLHEKQLLISVIAGLSIATIGAAVQASVPIVRTMPNTSSTIGCGATGISYSSHVTEEQQMLVLDMFRSIGIVASVDESKLDLITGLSGSGPAYMYYMMESMIQAGVDGGLPEEMAKELVVQTVFGAARMVQTTGEEPSALRKKVTSPNGTTEAALMQLAEGGFSELVQAAVKRASERAAELGKLMTD